MELSENEGLSKDCMPLLNEQKKQCGKPTVLSQVVIDSIS